LKIIAYILPTAPLSAVSILWDPLPYLSEADSPFSPGILSGDIYLEDFEDQALNTPFVRQPENVTYRGQTIRSIRPDIIDGFVRSVDGDDGIVDFSGFRGDSWITTDIASNQRAGRMSFEFLPDDQGRYPRYVGIVVTAADDVDRNVSLAFFDLNNINVSNDSDLYDPRDWEPEPLPPGDPRTHRFIGFYHEEGLTRISLSNVWQVDHLQYGFALPEPSTSVLTFAAVLPLLFWRRSRVT
jgi:hypothetical protein